jgi:hypothetical protein
VTLEQQIADVMKRHQLSSVHIFTGAGWRAFGFRTDPKGFEASAESGEGATIAEAISNLDARLAEGPIHKAASK